MVRVILCDDNPMVLEKYRRDLLAIGENNRINLQILSFATGEALLNHFLDNPNSADILYLDILMGKMNGIDIAQALRENGCQAKIIYLTACEEFALQSFDTEPFHYIVKDSISPRKFEDIFLRACAAVQEQGEEYLAVTSGGALYKVPLHNIVFFKVDNRIITMHCTDTAIRYYGKLDQVEKDLEGKGFLRPHRSYLVNCYHIQRIEQGVVFLDDENQVPVSAKNLNEVRRLFAEYLLRGGN